MSGHLAVTLGKAYHNAVRRLQADNWESSCRNAFAKHLFRTGTGFRTEKDADIIKRRFKSLRERMGKNIPVQAGFGGVLLPQEIRDTDRTQYYFTFTEDGHKQHTSNSPWGFCTNGDLKRVTGLQGPSRFQYVHWSKFLTFYKLEHDAEFADQMAYLAFNMYSEAILGNDAEDIMPGGCLFYDALANLLRVAFPALSAHFRGEYLMPLFSDHHREERREIVFATACIAIKGDWSLLTKAWKENKIAYIKALPTARSFKNNDIYMASILAALKEFYDHHM